MQVWALGDRRLSQDDKGWTALLPQNWQAVPIEIIWQSAHRLARSSGMAITMVIGDSPRTLFLTDGFQPQVG